jgi:hypothetical protein
MIATPGLRFEQAKAVVDQAEASLRQAESRIGIGAGSAFDAVRVPEVQAAQAAYESAKAKGGPVRRGCGSLCRAFQEWRCGAKHLREIQK